MLGHDHISDQSKGVAQANLIENPDKAISRTDCTEVRASPVTAESDKMQVVASVEALERITGDSHWRKRNVKIRTLKPEGCGTQA